MRGRHNGGHHNGNNNGRRINPRVQTFDSNGPDVRIRGNAFQVNEKYLALARDAASAGDRVLAESYFQHAEHYQRLINEHASFEQQHQQQSQGQQPQPQTTAPATGNGAAGNGQQPQPHIPDDAMPDLDQGFLVGDRSRAARAKPSAEAETKEAGSA